MKFLLPLFLLAPLCLASPISGVLTLSTDPGDNVLGVVVSVTVPTPFGPRTVQQQDQTVVSGFLEIGGKASATTAVVSEAELLGGSLTFTDMAFSFLGGIQSVRTQSVTGTPSTISDPAAVDTNQNFDAAAFLVTLDGGTVNANGIETFSQTLSTDPLPVAGQGQGSIELVQTATALNVTNYIATVSLPVNATNPVQSGTSNIQGTITVTGSLTASGPVRIYTNSFVRWAVENNLVDDNTAPSFTEDENGDGIPNGLAWALGLSGDEVVSEPILTIDSERNASLILVNELQGQIDVESGTDLDVDNWENPIMTLTVGNTGDITLPVSSDPRRFYRLKAVEPME